MGHSKKFPMLINAIKLSSDYFPLHIWNLQKTANDPFTEALAYILTDFRNSCLGKTQYNHGDERTIFVEVSAPIFKTFGNVLGHASFI
jgi:hypothetical protein